MSDPLRRFVVLSLLLISTSLTRAEDPPTGQVQSLKITILSTMLADGPELGEWGFAALVEVDGQRILFDTGTHSDLVLKNVQSLGLNLDNVPDVIISHNHFDHVGGFLTLREWVRPRAAAALSRTHVGEGIFYPRSSSSGPRIEGNQMIRIKGEYERTGGEFVSHAQPAQIYPGVWLTGPVPRKYPERNWSGTGQVTTPDGVKEDNVPEDMALVFDTAQGLVVLTGCGHAGVINTIEHARSFIRPARVHALIGGVHLFAAKEETLAWTSGKLREYGVDHFIGAHCTGIETTFRLRQDLGLDRAHAVIGAVGATFELGQGIDPRNIAR